MGYILCRGASLRWLHLTCRVVWQAQAGPAAQQNRGPCLPSQTLIGLAFLRRSFPPGTNPGIRPMAHLWEPLRVVPKPLAVPLFSEAGGALTRLLLRRQVGFGLNPTPRCSAWRAACSCASCSGSR